MLLIGQERVTQREAISDETFWMVYNYNIFFAIRRDGYVAVNIF